MINVIITSYKELESTIKAIDSFLNQKINQKIKITVIDPFTEVEEALKKKYGKKVDFFLDPGEGKSYALNIFLERIYSPNKEDIIILTDGDVYVSENSVSEILKAFEDKTIGCINGRPVTLDSKKNMFGYWSHLVFEGAHRVRRRLSNQEKFFECSGYLFAIRNGVLQGFPVEVSEDGIIPYLFWKKGYKIKYSPKAEVYVSNNYNWERWKKQKIRNIKGHENYNKVAPDMPRTKSFLKEVKEGTLFALFFPKNLREIIWTLKLFVARLFIYLKAFYDINIKKKKYQDGWRAEEKN